MDQKEKEQRTLWIWRVRVVTSLILLIFFQLKIAGDKHDYEKGCAAYIEAAATTEQIDFAKENLSIAISYAQKYDLVTGGKNNSIGIWYEGLQKIYLELEQLPNELSNVERLSILSWLRTSIDNVGVMPHGWDPAVDIHPAYSIFCVGSVLVFMLSVIKSI